MMPYIGGHLHVGIRHYVVAVIVWLTMYNVCLFHSILFKSGNVAHTHTHTHTHEE